MREYFIKLYCTLGEIQKQKESAETEELRKHIDDMKASIKILQEENKNLMKEIEQVKNKINSPREPVQRIENGNTQDNKDTGKDRRKDKKRVMDKGKETTNNNEAR